MGRKSEMSHELLFTEDETAYCMPQASFRPDAIAD